MKTIDLPYDIAMASSDVQQHYLKMLADGQSPRFAEMCALQVAPGTKGSERAFMEGRLDGNWMDGLPKRQAKWMLAEARKAGINPTGKFYMSGLADKRGHMDPEAWVDSIDDVRRVARKRNLNVQGAVTIEARDEGRKEVALNPRIEKEFAKKEIAKNPKLKLGEAIERVRQKHAPRWKRGKT